RLPQGLLRPLRLPEHHDAGLRRLPRRAPAAGRRRTGGAGERRGVAVPARHPGGRAGADRRGPDARRGAGPRGRPGPGRARPPAGGRVGAAGLPAKAWTTQEWLHFLTTLPNDVGRARLADLDAAFSLTRSGNAEIVFQWLLLALRQRYEPAYPRLEEFLTTQ